MNHSSDGTGGPDLRRRVLVLCSLFAAISVVALFAPLHEILPSHSSAILSAGLGGVVAGAAASRWAVRNASGKDMTWVGGVGGAAGLVLLHLLPLIY